MPELRTDVFIAGAGPSGLVLAYQLRRLGVSTYIVDSADKASPQFPMYGRACTLYPRTLEMLDQLDLYDDMAQEGFTSSRFFYYRHGERHFGRGWSLLGDVAGTYFPQNMNLRLKYSEDIFREKLAELETKVHAPLKVVDLRTEVDAADEYKVVVTCVDTKGIESVVRAKYVVGADGGSSSVRKLAGIPFTGEHTSQHWVRIDAMVKTNLPESRQGLGTMDTDTHGNVLWIALDHGATRIGYALSAEMYAKYGREMTQEEVIHEAKRAIAPFELEFERVDWHTVYGIGQMLADRLVDRERIILVGDAAHTHSSASAQGMNTGMHDVVSLGWRLAGVLNGWYRPDILPNYSEERLETARSLIEQDKTVSTLISGRKPEHMKTRPESVADLLSQTLSSSIGFIDGLTISYPPNLLNDVAHSLPSVRFRPGHRPYDVLLRKPGFQKQTVRLFEVTKNNGKFHVLVFVGKAAQTGDRLKSLRKQVDQYAAKIQHAIDFITIIDGIAYAVDEHLGLSKFGKAYWDADASAHETFAISGSEGALVILRPDGIVGASAGLDQFEEMILPYFEGVIIPKAEEDKPGETNHAGLGELINVHENLVYRRS